MNNIFLNQQPDPLMSLGNNDRSVFPMVDQNLLREYMAQQQHNWIDELDNLVKSLNPQVIQTLNSNQEYQKLNTEFQGYVNSELMELIRARLNSKPGVIDNIKKQIDIIKDVKEQVANVERENMSELTDYMKNYSHLTFDEYRKLKKDESR
jgi:CII-binding regulator of phage lambda lysogenization HflD